MPPNTQSHWSQKLRISSSADHSSCRSPNIIVIRVRPTGPVLAQPSLIAWMRTPGIVTATTTVASNQPDRIGHQRIAGYTTPPRRIGHAASNARNTFANHTTSHGTQPPRPLILCRARRPWLILRATASLVRRRRRVRQRWQRRQVWRRRPSSIGGRSAGRRGRWFQHPFRRTGTKTHGCLILRTSTHNAAITRRAPANRPRRRCARILAAPITLTRRAASSAARRGRRLGAIAARPRAAATTSGSTPRASSCGRRRRGRRCRHIRR